MQLLCVTCKIERNHFYQLPVSVSRFIINQQNSSETAGISRVVTSDSTVWLGLPTPTFTDWIWLLSDLTCWNAQHEDEHINLFLSISNELCPFYLLAIYMNASSLWTELFLQVKLDHFLIGDPWRWSNQILMHIL